MHLSSPFRGWLAAVYHPVHLAAQGSFSKPRSLRSGQALRPSIVLDPALNPCDIGWRGKTAGPKAGLRRPFVAGRVFFITHNLLRTRAHFAEADFETLADALTRVRLRRRCLLTGYVFMPDHWHALVYPAPADTLPGLMNSLKVAAAQSLNRLRHTSGELWQSRYFDRAVRSVKEYREKLAYMHLNPVRKGLVARPEDWLWSSIHSYGGPGPIRLEVDRLDLPPDENTPLLGPNTADGA